MKTSIRSLVVGFLVLCLAAGAGAQESVGERRTLLVSVLDAHGQPVSGLAAEQFRMTLRRQTVKTVSAQEVLIAGRIVFLVDTSASMASPHNAKLRDVLSAVQLTARLIGDQHEMALLSVGNKVEKHFGFQKGSAQILAALGKTTFNTKGRTALFDGIAEAIRLLDPVRLGDAVLVFSDGGDNASRTTERDLSKLVQDSGARIFAVAIYEPLGLRGRTAEELNGPRVLSEMILDSGGMMVESKLRFSKLEDTQLTVVPLLTAMVYGYLIEVELPTRQEKAGTLKLSVMDSQQKKLKNVILIFPNRLQPSSPSPN